MVKDIIGISSPLLPVNPLRTQTKNIYMALMLIFLIDLIIKTHLIDL